MSHSIMQDSTAFEVSIKLCILIYNFWKITKSGLLQIYLLRWHYIVIFKSLQLHLCELTSAVANILFCITLDIMSTIKYL